MTTPEVIRDLIEKVEAGSGRDWELCREIGKAFDYIEYDNLVTSIDAAVALTEKLLPGWNWGVICERVPDDIKPCQGNVYPGAQPFPAQMDVYGYGHTPPRALLSATLRALLAKMETE